MPSLILQKAHGTVSAPDFSVTLSSPVTNYSLLLAFAISYSAGGGSGVSPTDSNLNVWSSNPPYGFPYHFPVPAYYISGSLYMWYAKRCAPGATTIAFPGLVDGDTVAIYEIAGFAELDDVGYLSPDPPYIDETGAFAYSPGDILVALFTGRLGDSYTGFAAGAESTLLDNWQGQTAAGNFPVLTEYQVATAPGNYAATCIDSTIGGNSGAMLAAFRPLVTAPGPSPGGIVPGFAILASNSPQGDGGLPPWASFLAIPSSSPPSTPISVFWATMNASAVEVADPSLSPPLDTGRVSTTGGGAYTIGDGFGASTALLCTAYDLSGEPFYTQTLDITITGVGPSVLQSG
jgi:hypothetical protein